MKELDPVGEGARAGLDLILVSVNAQTEAKRNLAIDGCYISGSGVGSGRGRAGAKQDVVYKSPRVFPTGSVLLVTVIFRLSLLDI